MMVVCIMYTGVIRFHYLIEHLYLICVWLVEEQRTNTIKTHVEINLDYIFKFY